MNRTGSVSDQAGRTVRLPSHVKRIVSLAPSNTEIIYALGAEDLLVGVTEYCDYPPQAKRKTKVGGYSTIETDRVEAVKPDLILAGLIHIGEVMPQLERLGYPVLVLEASTVAGLLDAIKLCGTCTGREKAAKSLVAELGRRAEAVTSKTSGIPVSSRPKVYFLHECDTWKTFGGKTIGDTLTDLAGGYNIGRDFGEYYPYPSFDEIFKSNPDIIIAETGYGSDPEAPLRVAHSEPRLSGVAAIKEGKVYGISSDLVSRAGPRLVDGLEQLAKIIHPETFF